jgi:ketosteroid isomerase-like protein
MKRLVLGLALAALVGMPWAARAQGGSDVLAEAEIARLTSTYAWSVDAMDIDTLMTIFSDDVEYDLTTYYGISIKGWQNVKNFFVNTVFPTNACSFIMISNIWSEVAGTKANGGDYYLHTGYNPTGMPPGTLRETKGRHIYRFKKVRGEWKISYLKGELFVQTSQIISRPPANCPLPPAM